MGNYCERRSQNNCQSEYEKTIANTKIILIQSNLTNQTQIEILINWFDCFLLNENTSILKNAMNTQLSA